MGWTRYGWALRLLLPLSLPACQSLPDVARERFSVAYSCALGQVEARDRPELTASSLTRPPRPPPEIARDPVKMQVWQEEQEAGRPSFAPDMIVAVRGCEKSAFYGCRSGSKRCWTLFDFTEKVPRW